MAVGRASLFAQKPLSEEGTLLGTFQYMAPEQLEGEEADPRSDIFALEAILYEMVTDQKAFSIHRPSRSSFLCCTKRKYPRVS